MTEHPLDALDAIAADVLSDTEAAEQFTANDYAATFNQACQRAGNPKRITPAQVLRVARGEVQLDPETEAALAELPEVIEIPPDAMHAFDEVFGPAGDDPDSETP